MGLLQEGADSLHGAGARFAAIAKVENEPGIAHHVAAEAGRGGVVVPKEFFNVSKQLHS